jgi:SAM-dependent methyltransferase
MATADPRNVTQRVRDQYERFPYPARSPIQEPQRIRATNLDELPSLNHYVFGGRRDFSKDFRILVAGGGTGDSTIFLAEQLRHTAAEIVHLDLSEASINLARQRARSLALEGRIEWIQGSLLDLPRSDLPYFDYINCTGVLHHLEHPEEGLAALLSRLKDDGGLGLMLYGKYGRTAVYPLQQLMRLVNHADDDPEVQLQNLKEVLAALPGTNWHRRASMLALPDAQRPDTELYDTYLHSQDEPYSVPGLYRLLEAAGLKLVAFTRTSRPLYGPALLGLSPQLREPIDRLSPPQLQAFAELFWGTVRKHEFWAARRGDTAADRRDLRCIPMLTEYFDRVCGGKQAVLDCQDPAWQFDHPITGGLTISVKLPLGPATRRFLESLDGNRSTGEIIDTMADRLESPPPRDRLADHCVGVLETLLGLDMVALRQANTPRPPGY